MCVIGTDTTTEFFLVKKWWVEMRDTCGQITIVISILEIYSGFTDGNVTKSELQQCLQMLVKITTRWIKSCEMLLEDDADTETCFEA